VSKSKLILSNPLIEGLIELGVISEHCTAFILIAKIGEPLVLRETRYVTRAQAEHLAANIEVIDTYSPETSNP